MAETHPLRDPTLVHPPGLILIHRPDRTRGNGATPGLARAEARRPARPNDGVAEECHAHSYYSGR